MSRVVSFDTRGRACAISNGRREVRCPYLLGLTRNVVLDTSPITLVTATSGQRLILEPFDLSHLFDLHRWFDANFLGSQRVSRYVTGGIIWSQRSRLCNLKWPEGDRRNSSAVRSLRGLDAVTHYPRYRDLRPIVDFPFVPLHQLDDAYFINSWDLVRGGDWWAASAT